MTKYEYRYPSCEELYALELEARRLRAEALSQALRAGAARVKSLYGRAMSAIGAKVVRHA
jgi:hypothetical protein